METKRCSGYKGHWECEGEYPDHMVPVDKFSGHSGMGDNLQDKCRKCVDYRNPANNPRGNAISALAYKMAGGSNQFYKLPKEERLELRSVASSELGAKYTVPTSDTTKHGANVLPMFKREDPIGAPMRTREASEMQGEFMPQGWVYVVQNPDLPHVLKIGKTYPDGIGGIMSSARRFGRAILVEKHYFDEALKAEAAIHAILNKWNMRNLGHDDCGRELFKCSVNCFRKALLEYQEGLESADAVG